MREFPFGERLTPLRWGLVLAAGDGKDHFRYEAARRQVAPRAPENVNVQLANRETGPGILLPLLRLYKRCPDASVAVFPSDHFILEEDRFMDHVALAARAVAHGPSRFVLLAAEAQDAETEYGYIVPHDNYERLNIWGIRGTASFVEKPDAAACARWLTQAHYGIP